MNPLFVLFLGIVAGAHAALQYSSTCNSTSLVVNGYWYISLVNSQPNQSCVFQLLPWGKKGIYLQIHATRLGPSESVIVNDEFSSAGSTSGSLTLRANYPKAVNVSLQTNGNSTADISVQVEVYQDLRNVSRAVGYTIVEPLIMDMFDLQRDSAHVFRTNSRVVLTTLNMPDAYYSLQWLNFWLFEGEGTNAVFVGNLYETINNGQFISNGSILSLYVSNLGLSHFQLIVNDYDSVKQFTEMKTAWKTPGQQLLTLNATAGPAVLTIGSYSPSNNLYLMQISAGNTSGTMKVYAGAPFTNRTSFMLSTYNTSSSADYLPQEFAGQIRTFELDTGIVTINITANDKDAGWSVPRTGRKGFVMTPFYPFNSTAQDVKLFSMATVTTIYNFVFKYISTDVNFANSTYTLSTAAADGNVSVLSGMPANLVNLTSKGFNFTLNSGNMSSTGGLLTFEMTAVKGARGMNGIMALVFVLRLLLLY